MGFIRIIATICLVLNAMSSMGQTVFEDYYRTDKGGLSLGMYPTTEALRKDLTTAPFDKYDMVWRQNNGLFVVKRLMTVSKKGKELFSWLVDKNDNKLTKTYTDIGDFYDGMAEVSNIDKCLSCWPERYSYVEVNHNTRGYINDKGKEVIKLQYRVAGRFSEGYAAVGYWINEIFFISKKGEQMFNKTFKEARHFEHGVADVVLKSGSLNYINLSGELLIPRYYLFIRPHEKNVIRAFTSLSGKTGFWNSKNELLLEPQYDDFNYEIWPGRVLVKQNRKFGFIDSKTGKQVIPVAYEDVRTARSDQFIWMKINKKWIKVDINHQINSEIVADDVKTIDQNRLLYSFNKKWGLADNTGKILRIAEFDYIEPQLSENKMVVIKKGKYGYLDSSGNLIIPAVYDKVSRFSKGEVQGIRGNYVYNINAKNIVLSKSLSSSMIIKTFMGSGGMLILIGVFFLFRYRV
jgi:hypothetical protein